MNPISTVILGSGWRADQLADALSRHPDFVLRGFGARNTGAASSLARKHAATAAGDAATVLREVEPELVFVAVAPEASADLIALAVEHGARVVVETPPASPERLDGLAERYADTVAVAEQYPRYPLHAARLELIARGVIGMPTSASISSTQLHHAAALLRLALRVNPRTVRVRAREWTTSIVDVFGRQGWDDSLEPRERARTVATIEFDDGLLGFYDFTANQWNNRLIPAAMTVRGTHGEIRDDVVTRIVGPRTIVPSRIMRVRRGDEMDVFDGGTESLVFEGDVVARRPPHSTGQTDEAWALSSFLDATAEWVRDGAAPPYPLTAAILDARIGRAIVVSVEEDREVRLDLSLPRRRRRDR
ncbi:Gfo/Idh/MocA family oxidoreductase [Microbacterium sp. X-17]|uniref:Gfo/Idh/MocA family oxidoreductase n=1 Tax=Microbacterium sp. X-17 TaxID=3144404 RepID=UPI0031F58275